MMTEAKVMSAIAQSNAKEAAALDMLAALRDTAGMLPVAARLHPKDLADLQSAVVAAIAKAEAAGIKP